MSMQGVQGVENLVLDGVTGVAQTDYTRGEVFNVYQQVANTIQNMPDPQSTSYDAAVNLLNAQLNELVALYKNGLLLNVDPSKPSAGQFRYYITVGMAQQLQTVFQSLTTAGINVTQPINMTSDQATNWLALVNTSGILSPYFASAGDPSPQVQSLQAAVELQYVKTSNDVMASQIDDLQSALSTTQTILENLVDLQQLHNKIAIYNRGNFTSVTGFNWSGTGTTPEGYVDNYQAAASSFFAGAIVPVIASEPEYYVTPLMASLINLVQASVAAGGSDAVKYSDGLLDDSTDSFVIRIPSNYPQSSLPPLTSLQAVFPGIIYTQDSATHPPTDVLLLVRSQTTPGTLERFNGAMTGIKTILLDPSKYVITGLNTSDPRLSFPTGDYLGQRLALDNFRLKQTGLDDLKNEIVKARNDLDTQIANLQSLMGSTSTTAAAAADSSSLIQRLQKIRSDFSTLFVTANGTEIQSSTSMDSAYSGLSAWLVDRYDRRNTPDAVLAGALQRNISAAQSAAQALNDTKKADVQNFLFVFQEYYKSAAAILQQLTQIIQRAAQSVGGR